MFHAKQLFKTIEQFRKGEPSKYLVQTKGDEAVPFLIYGCVTDVRGGVLDVQTDDILFEYIIDDGTTAVSVYTKDANIQVGEVYRCLVKAIGEGAFLLIEANLMLSEVLPLLMDVVRDISPIVAEPSVTEAPSAAHEVKKEESNRMAAMPTLSLQPFDTKKIRVRKEK